MELEETFYGKFHEAPKVVFTVCYKMKGVTWNHKFSTDFNKSKSDEHVVIYIVSDSEQHIRLIMERSRVRFPV